MLTFALKDNCPEYQRSNTRHIVRRKCTDGRTIDDSLWQQRQFACSQDLCYMRTRVILTETPRYVSIRKLHTNRDLVDAAGVCLLIGILEDSKMAKCERCGRGPLFGNNRPWSKKATRRRWNINVAEGQSHGRRQTSHQTTVHLLHPRPAKGLDPAIHRCIPIADHEWSAISFSIPPAVHHLLRTD